MKSIYDIHAVALAELKKNISLNPVSLKYPLPERPVRALGLVKIDGEIFSSEKFTRIVLLKLTLPFYLTVLAVYLRPKMELDLPVFSTDILIAGKKRMFLMDPHRAGDAKEDDDAELFDKLVEIRERYPGLMKRTEKQKGEIQKIFSRAVCQVKITEEQDEEVLSIFRKYIQVFLETVEKAPVLSGEELEQARQAFERYVKKIIDHDPGAKSYNMLFGKKGGIVRSLDNYYGI